ncbi:hypothetical protein TIFTF001_046268 [Ficus carica]|uniref:Uncharacterized protein n=1 Tax=Ficus carica TaxID=3494 RepID=A0AA87ZKW1_FICCA|nr:hypothetical protein TIFTF001_046268 [Ficus carica]
MALPAPILDIPQRLAEINVEIQNVENAIQTARRRLSHFLRVLRPISPAVIDARLEVIRQRIQELKERLEGLRQEQQTLIVDSLAFGG